jgi:cation transport regulator ChaC
MLSTEQQSRGPDVEQYLVGIWLWIADLGSGLSHFTAPDRQFATLAPQLLHALDPPSRHPAGDGVGVGAGVAFRVMAGAEDLTLAMLRERELISSAYMENWLPVTLENGVTQTALAYVINPDHDQYCGGLPLEEQAQIIARAKGGRGTNRDYLFSTAQHLGDLGIGDPDLDWLVARVAQLPA